MSKKIEQLPEDGEVRKRFDLVKKIMDFNKKELPRLITDNYMFDRSKEVSELNPADIDNIGEAVMATIVDGV